jgi:hypothetical protein
MTQRKFLVRLCEMITAINPTGRLGKAMHCGTGKSTWTLEPLGLEARKPADNRLELVTDPVQIVQEKERVRQTPRRRSVPFHSSRSKQAYPETSRGGPSERYLPVKECPVAAELYPMALRKRGKQVHNHQKRNRRVQEPLVVSAQEGQTEYHASDLVGNDFQGNHLFKIQVRFKFQRR